MKKGHRDESCIPAGSGRSDRRARLLAIVAATLALGAACSGPAEGRGAERGAVLYGACVSCHGPSGGGNPDVGAPAIAGLPAWYAESQLLKFKSGLRGTHPDDEAGMRMRPMSLTLKTDDDAKAVAAYVASLPPVPADRTVEGDPAKGKALYATCMACHGADGSGNQTIGSPPLAGVDDWYLVAQLKKFKSGGRGTDPKDTTGLQMRAMSNTLTDDQAIRDVVAYIATLPAKGGR